MFVKLEVITRNGTREVEMPGTTTVKYAAKRVAEAMGYSGEKYWMLLKPSREPWPDDELVLEIKAPVYLAMKPR